jgi:hypothetical protein
MKHQVLRSLALGSALVGSLALGSTPASAVAGVAFTGTAHINCFGCGVSNGTAELCAHGFVGTVTIGIDVNCPNTHASFTVNEPASVPTCVISGSASGSTAGAVNVSFNWTRVGAVAVITTSGQINGSGVAVFAVTSPTGLPCGGAVGASVAGAVSGV